jgi:biotin carboxyl carrier protein
MSKARKIICLIVAGSLALSLITVRVTLADSKSVFQKTGEERPGTETAKTGEERPGTETAKTGEERPGTETAKTGEERPETEKAKTGGENPETETEKTGEESPETETAKDGGENLKTETDQDKEVSYKEVAIGDYEEKGTLKNLEWKYLRYDSLSIPYPSGTFVNYLVEEGQEVKKGEKLLSYRLPFDPISLEEKELKLKQSLEAYELACRQREAEIDESEKRLKILEQGTYDAKIAKLNLEKQKLSFRQYCYQTEKNLDIQKEDIKTIKAKEELQYLYAPYDGFIHKGEGVSEDMSIDSRKVLLTILDKKSAVLGTEVSGNESLWFDMKVSVTGIINRKEDKDNLHTGRILSSDSLFEGKLTTGMLYVAVDDRELVDTIQMANISAATVTVEQVPIIPIKSVKTENDRKFVYQKDSDGSLRRQYITGRDNGTDMWVYSGLSAGQNIVVD